MGKDFSQKNYLHDEQVCIAADTVSQDDFL